MRITVKKLQGGECSIEVLPTTTILEIKREIARKLMIPVPQQKLLLLGRTLLDEQFVESYPNLKDGSKLNVVMKKPETTQEEAYKVFKKSGMSDAEAKHLATRLLKIVEEKFNKLSWDDVDRLCHDCMMEMEELDLSKTLTQDDFPDAYDL